MMMKQLKTSLLVIIAIFFMGCSTPNVKTFVDETLQIKELAIIEHGEIKSKLEYLSIVHPKKKSKIAKQLKTFNDESKKIEDTFTYLINYSNAINVLSNDKTEGEQAIMEMCKNLSQISTLLNLLGMTIDIGGVTKSAANWITEIQKQNTLEKAMEMADPLVQEISLKISENYSKNMVVLANGVTDLLISSLDDCYPINAVGFYAKAIEHKNVIYMDMRSRLETLPKNTFTVLCPTKRNGHCIAKETIEAFNQINKLIEQTKPIYDSYIKDLSELKKWEKERITKIKKLSTLSKSWSKEHSRVLGILRNCNSLSKDCQDFKSINIIDIVKQ